MEEIIVTTTETIPGREIDKILGTVFGKSIKMIWMTEDGARNSALKKIMEQAEQMGADAIVGLGYDRKGAEGFTPITVGAYGTAVRLAPCKSKK